MLFAIELATRRVEIPGIVPEPYGTWMGQVARNATDAFAGFLTGKRYLITDRDSRFAREFRAILEAAGVEVLRMPPRSPNLNAFAERFVRSIEEECPSRWPVLQTNSGSPRSLFSKTIILAEPSQTPTRPKRLLKSGTWRCRWFSRKMSRGTVATSMPGS